MQKFPRDTSHIDALQIMFYMPNPSGPHNPAPLEGLEMFHDSCIPMTGDVVYDVQSAEAPTPYRVMSRHFDLKGLRVAVMVEKVDTIENSPFLSAVSSVP